jgi:hypothetical protein
MTVSRERPPRERKREKSLDVGKGQRQNKGRINNVIYYSH